MVENVVMGKIKLNCVLRINSQLNVADHKVKKFTISFHLMGGQYKTKMFDYLFKFFTLKTINSVEFITSKAMIIIIK